MFIYVNRVIPPRQADDEDLKTFHSSEYVECLKRLSTCEDEEKFDEEAEVFGLCKFEMFGVYALLILEINCFIVLIIKIIFI